jgi:uncharacterized Zn finger protein (UPF0148 family)
MWYNIETSSINQEIVMEQFFGEPCPVCKQAFAEGDDIVVCPECGAPCHRGCWQGQCEFEALHSAEYRWTSMKVKFREMFERRAKEQEQTEKQAKLVATGIESVDTVNSLLSRFSQIRTGAETEYGGRREQGDYNTDSRDIYDVSEREIAQFRGRVNPAELLKYRAIARGHRFSINVFAGLLMPMYQFYSRQRLFGVILTLMQGIAALPELLIQLNIMGILDINKIQAADPFITGIQAGVSLPAIWQWLCMGVMIWGAICYDRFYLRWMTKKIKHIRARFSSDEQNGGSYFYELQRVGKPRIGIMILDFFITSIAVSLLFTFAVMMLI